mgnify:CR=1 FL=1
MYVHRSFFFHSLSPSFQWSIPAFICLLFFFRKVCIICPFFFRQIADNLIRSLVMFFHLSFAHLPAKSLSVHISISLISGWFFRNSSSASGGFLKRSLCICAFSFGAAIPPRKADIYPSFPLPMSCVPVHQYTLHIRQLALFLFQVEYKSCTFFHSRSAPS